MRGMTAGDPATRINAVAALKAAWQSSALSECFISPVYTDQSGRCPPPPPPSPVPEKLNQQECLDAWQSKTATGIFNLSNVKLSVLDTA
jgi:hypothetical protein